MKITYFGHSCFMVETNTGTVLFDPFITPNPLAVDIDITIIKPDHILITHGHGDHLADAQTIAKQSGAQLIANYEITTWFEGKGISNVHPMNIGGNIKLPLGKVKLVQAVHSSTMPDGTPGGNPVGFVVASERTFYYAGDTALTLDMQLIGEQFDLDFAFLPIGDNFTMGPEDALRCAEMINCNKIIGMHYDTFPYIKIDTLAAQRMFEVRGKELICMKIGESITL